MKCLRFPKILNDLRKIQTVQTAKKSTAKAVSFATVDKHFDSSFPDVVRDLTKSGNNTVLAEVDDWVATVLQSTVPNGNKKRGMLVPLTYKTLEDPDKITSENIKLSNILGWCFEMNLACLVIIDDIFDGSETRRGGPAWHRHENVGMGALNDSLLVENCAYLVLQHYFSKLPCYVKCLELFHENTILLAKAGTLENLTAVKGKSSFDEFTMTRYNAITTLKSESYNFLFPMTLAMHLANKFDPKIYSQVSPCLKAMGRLAQINNDFQDCFGSAKIGTDIQEGRCSWLITTALERATSAQKAILRANYGKTDPGAGSTVKNLYEEMDLPRVHAEYVAQELNVIRDRIEKLVDKSQNKAFLKFLVDIADHESWKATDWWRF